MKTRILKLGAIILVMAIGGLNAQVITEVGTVITESGDYIVEKNLLCPFTMDTSAFTGITVNANDVIVDLQGYRLVYDFIQRNSLNQVGVLVNGDNVTIKNAREISGFYSGIRVNGKGCQIFSNAIKRNTYAVDFNNSDNGKICDNIIDDSNFIGIFVKDGDSNEIGNNNVYGNALGICLNRANKNYIHHNVGQNTFFGIIIVDNSNDNYGDNNNMTASHSEHDIYTEGNNYVFNIGTMVEGITQIKEFALFQNYPNPFNASTTIVYQIPSASYVSLKIYNIAGQEVATLVDEYQITGNYQREFDASQLSSGIYLYHLKTERFSKKMKMILQK